MERLDADNIGWFNRWLGNIPISFIFTALKIIAVAIIPLLGWMFFNLAFYIFNNPSIFIFGWLSALIIGVISDHLSRRTANDTTLQNADYYNNNAHAQPSVEATQEEMEESTEITETEQHDSSEPEVFHDSQNEGRSGEEMAASLVANAGASKKSFSSGRLTRSKKSRKRRLHIGKKLASSTSSGIPKPVVPSEGSIQRQNTQ